MLNKLGNYIASTENVSTVHDVIRHLISSGHLGRYTETRTYMKTLFSVLGPILMAIKLSIFGPRLTNYIIMRSF